MKQLLPLLFMLIFLAILVLANMYLGRRFAWFFDAGTVRPYFFAFIGITVYMIGGLAGFTNSTGLLGQLLYSSAAILMGFALYLLLSVLLVDLAGLVVPAKPLYSGFAALSLALLISAFGMVNAFNVRTNSLEVEIPTLKKELRLMHWTDVHLGHFRGTPFLERLVEKTNAEQVDMVLITGDLFDGTIRFRDSTLMALRNLNAPAYFVAGNHDGYSGVEKVKAGLREVGVHVLSNEVVKADELQLIGLNHMLADSKASNMHAFEGGATIQSTLGSLAIETDQPTILMHHSPDGIQYACEKGVDLYLSGHTHAGQLFPVTLIGKLIYTYPGGFDSYKGTQIYVGSGVGTFGPPMRVGTRSTITCINLKPGSKSVN